jgi:hypothetical protein
MADARKKKLPPLIFSKLGISPGATLTFNREPKITCVVVADRKVNFEGHVYYHSRAALIVLKRHFRYKGREASGSVYWQYGGGTLEDRRARLEEKEPD